MWRGAKATISACNYATAALDILTVENGERCPRGLGVRIVLASKKNFARLQKTVRLREMCTPRGFHPGPHERHGSEPVCRRRSHELPRVQKKRWGPSLRAIDRRNALGGDASSKRFHDIDGSFVYLLKALLELTYTRTNLHALDMCLPGNVRQMRTSQMASMLGGEQYAAQSNARRASEDMGKYEA